ncbi:MAG: nucleotidyltransferase domain-containing protein [Acidaminococcaceae bacterium]|nr:nucleotidyltransferase domain-containing protein [Acidaminococcaceae bacterium]MBQ6744884.1 nucleotidyltransferase domain-containing protein [Acidaminococcaceae bacterium]MBQ6779547.1 nucleotidyltransferase domain-containing protein [Acidaminococcaceae bacterium]
MTALKEMRISKQITQQEAARRLGISLRSYIMYENDATKENTIKYRFLMQELQKINAVDEEHGILTTEQIRMCCKEILDAYQVEYCYLFGSYAKGKATEQSDVDLLISTKEKGLRFYEIAERLRESLHKKVDLLDVKQLVNNEMLIDEMLKEGIKIYG